MLPSFYGKIATIIVADKKLQVLLLCLTGLKVISLVLQLAIFVRLFLVM